MRSTAARCRQATPIAAADFDAFYRDLRRRRRQGRRGGVRRAAALAHRDAAARRAARRPAHPCRHVAGRHHLARDQVRRRPHGAHPRIEDAGGIVASGVCFYQSYAREMAEANGWQRLLTNSAKLVNIIAGYGYKPTLGDHGALHRQRGCRKDRVMPIVLKCHKGLGPAVTGTALVARGQLLRPLRSRSPQGHLLAPRAQALRPELSRSHPGAADRQGRRRLRLDAARDGGARHGAEGHRLRPHQHHPGPGRRLRRVDHGRPLRGRRSHRR